jgi:glycerophosphoryl diester phosphodiesterase
MARFLPKTMKVDEFVKEVSPAAVELDAEDVTGELCKAFHAKGIKVEANAVGEKWDNPTILGQSAGRRCGLVPNR